MLLELFCFYFRVVLLCSRAVSIPLGCNQLGTSSFLQEKVLEYWSPAPLPEGDVGKNAAAPADLKEPEAADLEVSSDSSIGDDSDVEVAGASAPPHPPTSARCRRTQAVRKISASKAGMRGALSNGAPAAASGSGSEEVGMEDAPQMYNGSGAAPPAWRTKQPWG